MLLISVLEGKGGKKCPVVKSVWKVPKQGLEPGQAAPESMPLITENRDGQCSSGLGEV